MVVKKQKGAAAAQSTQPKSFPKLPIVYKMSEGKPGSKFTHGVGVLPIRNEQAQPRIMIGAVWFPTDEGETEPHPAFMRGVSTLTLEDAAELHASLAVAIKAAHAGDCMSLERPKKPEAAPAQPTADVAALAKQAAINALLALGLTQEQADAAYAKGNAAMQPVAPPMLAPPVAKGIDASERI